MMDPPHRTARIGRGFSRGLWSRLREDLGRIVSQMRKEDGNSVVMTRGLQPLHHITFPAPLTCVRYVAGEQCLVSVDCDGNVCLHHENGRIRHQTRLSWPISGLLYGAGVQLYVAWNQQGLFLLDKTLATVSQSHVEDEVHCCVYDPWRNLLLTGGTGGVSVWKFAPRGHRLVRTRSLKTTDSVHIIALDEESHNPQTCVAACGSHVWEFHLLDGNLMRLRKNLHPRIITSLVYSENPRLLISGSRDRTIKVWGADGELTAVFVGHTGAITSLSLRTSTMTLSSGCEDRTLRMWDLNTEEQTEELEISGSPIGIEMFGGDADLVLCYSSFDLHIWQIRQLYQLHCHLGTDVKDIRVMGGGDIPLRALCVCADGTVRVISADTGDLVSMLSLGGDGNLLGADYCLHKETVCVLLKDGQLLKADATANPMRVMSKKNVGSDRSLPRCFIVYSNTTDAEAEVREWKQVVKQQGDREPPGGGREPPGGDREPPGGGREPPGRGREPPGGGREPPGGGREPPGGGREPPGGDREPPGGDREPPGGDREPPGRDMKNRSFLVIGSDDGTLLACDWYSWNPLCQTKAHSPGPVTSLTCDSKNKYIISAGSDLTVKVWRLLAHAPQSLSLCTTFSCSQPVGRMCSFKSELFVAFHDPSTASSSLVQYCLRTESRRDHPPSDDHQDQITGLCCCPALRLLATCGTDGRIRVWNDQNQLLRTLRLNSTPESMTFAGDCGDLLVGMCSHLFHISLAKLLPQSYQVKILCMAARSTVTDPPVPPGHVMSLGTDDENRLAQTPLLRKGLCTDKGGTWKTEEQQQEYLSLSFRDQELLLLREGTLRPHKKLKSNKKTRREAMENYLQLVYRRRPCIQIPEDEDEDVAVNEEPPVRTTENVPDSPGGSNRGFFSDSAFGFPFRSFPRHQPVSFSSIGTFPNSALLQLLWPMECVEIHEQKTEEKPIFFSKYISNVKEEIEEADEHEVDEVTEELEESSDIPAILQRITTRMEESSPEPDPTPVPSSPTHPIQRRDEKKTTSLPQRPLISRIPRPRPPATKTSRQTPLPIQLDPPQPTSPPNTTPKVSSPSPDTDKEEEEEEEEWPLETSTRVPEIPPFITQFQSTSWFSRIFPDIQEVQSGFEAGLLRGVVHMELPIRIELLHALRMLYQEGHLKDPKGTFRTLMEVVVSGRGLRMKNIEDLDFLWFCLHFLIQLSGSRRDVILELLVTCVQTRPSHRERFLGLFKDIGVEDPHGFIGRKVTTWEHTQGDREILKKTCQDWLDIWTGRLLDYLRAAMNQQKSIRDRGKGPRSHGPPHVTPSDVLNYYCELQMKTEIQTIRGADLAGESTVLALPPIHRTRALLRLGETNTDSRHKDHKGVTLPPIPQRLLPGVTFINLPVKRISINPFTPTRGDSPGPAPLTGSLTQEVHQYFILQHSYLESFY